MKNNKTKLLALNGVIAAVYAVMTLINPLSFGVLQLRFSTLLLPLSFYVPQVRAGLVLGTFIGNMNSSLGIIDMIFGTLVSAICVYGCQRIKNRYLQTICYALDSGIIVAIELYYCFKAPIVYSIFTVGISGLIIYFIGTFIMKIISKTINKYFI